MVQRWSVVCVCAGHVCGRVQVTELVGEGAVIRSRGQGPAAGVLKGPVQFKNSLALRTCASALVAAEEPVVAPCRLVAAVVDPYPRTRGVESCFAKGLGESGVAALDLGCVEGVLVMDELVL